MGVHWNCYLCLGKLLVVGTVHGEMEGGRGHEWAQTGTGWGMEQFMLE